MRWFKRLGLGLGLIICLLIAWQINAWWRFLHTPIIIDKPQIIELKPGTGLWSLSKELQRRGLLSQPTYFEWLARISGADKRLRAGEYALPVGITPLALLDLLSSTKVIQYNLTLIEGWNNQQILAALANHPAIEHSLAGLSVTEIKQRLGITEPHLEGLFYPDTYQFTKGTTNLAFLSRAHGLLQNYLQAEWMARAPNLPYQTPYQALIAASLIEKEAKLEKERPLISGIIVKRLQNNMRLQIDASVIYGLGENYKGRLSRSDMRVDTPYNTYLYKGLPPTPIAIPSLASIHAALHPVITNNIFYVARGDGGHYFSADLANHNAAIRQFLLNKQTKPGLIPAGNYSINLFNLNQSATKFCSANLN